MYGVPEGETKVASTAGAGSLLIEYEVLSRLSGDESFGRALLSMKSIYKRRSSVGLLVVRQPKPLGGSFFYIYDIYIYIIYTISP